MHTRRVSHLDGAMHSSFKSMQGVKPRHPSRGPTRESRFLEQRMVQSDFRPRKASPKKKARKGWGFYDGDEFKHAPYLSPNLRQQYIQQYQLYHYGGPRPLLYNGPRTKRVTVDQSKQLLPNIRIKKKNRSPLGRPAEYRSALDHERAFQTGNFGMAVQHQRTPMSMQASSEHIPSYLNQYYIMTPPQHNSRSKYNLNQGRLSQEGLAMMAQAQMDASGGFSRMQYYTRGNSDQDYH